MNVKNLIKQFLAVKKATLKKWMIWVKIWGFGLFIWPLAGIVVISQTRHGSILLSDLAWLTVLTRISFVLLFLFGLPISLRIYWLDRHKTRNNNC